MDVVGKRRDEFRIFLIEQLRGFIFNRNWEHSDTMVEQA